MREEKKIRKKTKEEYKKYGALYRERHPEKIKQWKQTRVECECGEKQETFKGNWTFQ